jgi:hypothetical protein
VSVVLSNPNKRRSFKQRTNVARGPKFARSTTKLRDILKLIFGVEVSLPSDFLKLRARASSQMSRIFNGSCVSTPCRRPPKMRPSLRSASQSQPSTASGGSSSVPYHSAASRRLAKARAPSSSRSSQASSRESTPALSEPFLSSQDYPPADGESGTIGAQFDIRWDDIWKDGKKLS